MNSAFVKRGRFLAIFLALISSVFQMGCQEDLLNTEDVQNSSLKNGELVSVAMEGMLPGGAMYEIALPETWNYLPVKLLIVYAHGYVDVTKPVALPADMIAGMPIKDLLLNGIDYMGNPLPIGYASTSYRANGLVVLDAVEDIKQLREQIGLSFAASDYLPPDAIVLAGVSEGGLITVLTIEQNPGLFSAAFATCCPIGDFDRQLHYYGDAHVLFKYFFGPSFNDINIGSPKGVSKSTMLAWEDGSLKMAIAEALQNDYLYNGGNNIRQFIACARIPISEEVQALQPELTIQTILEVLRFPIMATNDAIERLGGNPYNNKYPPTEYAGSDNDRKLNLTVERVYRKTWEQANEEVGKYETTGILLTPLVSLHTQYDPISLIEQQALYALKVGDNPTFYPVPVLDRYGHCNFTIDEINQAIVQLLNTFMQQQAGS